MSGPTTATAGVPVDLHRQRRRQRRRLGHRPGELRVERDRPAAATGNPVTVTFPSAGFYTLRVGFKDLAGNAARVVDQRQRQGRHRRRPPPRPVTTTASGPGGHDHVRRAGQLRRPGQDVHRHAHLEEAEAQGQQVREGPPRPTSTSAPSGSRSTRARPFRQTLKVTASAKPGSTITAEGPRVHQGQARQVADEVDQVADQGLQLAQAGGSSVRGAAPRRPPSYASGMATTPSQERLTVAPIVGPDDPRRFTDSGIEIKALYTADDLPDELRARRARRVPVHRGVHREMYRKQLWTMRQYAGYASAQGVQRALPLPARPRAAPACRWPSTCRRSSAWTPTTRAAWARSAAPASRSTRSTTCGPRSTASRSTRSRRR